MSLITAAPTHSLTSATHSFRLQTGRLPHGRLVTPPLALGAPLLNNLLDWDLGWVSPLLAQLADGHEDAQQQVAHERAPCRLQVVHQGEALVPKSGIYQKSGL